MKFGSRHDFHVVDSFGDLVLHFWRTRQSFTMQDFVRRTLKMAVLILVALAMIHVLYPTQKKGWLLWLGPQEEDLASWTAIILVGFSAMILTLVRESWTHGHKILASFAGMFMAVLMTVVLGGAWNYYSATSSRAVNTSQAAVTGATSRIDDAARALTALDTSQARSLASIDAAVANAPANRLNGRAALLRQRTATETAGRAERARLETELKAARAVNVTTQKDEFDPRPIDKTMSQWFHADRVFMGSINDLIRSLNFEFIAILGVALGTAVALSRVGDAAPVSEPVAQTVQQEEPIVEDEFPPLDDLSHEDFAPSKAAEDARRSAAGRKSWATRRQKEDDEQAPVGTDDDRIMQPVDPEDAPQDDDIVSEPDKVTEPA